MWHPAWKARRGEKIRPKYAPSSRMPGPRFRAFRLAKLNDDINLIYLEMNT